MNPDGFRFGIPEIDIHVLLALSDHDLARFCQTHRYANSICQNDYFWQLKAEQSYPQLAHLRPRYSSYRELYQTLKFGAYAVHLGDSQVTLHNDIQSAYNEFLQHLKLFIQSQGLPAIERAEELINVVGERRFPLSLYLVDSDNNSDTLIDLTTPQIVISPNLDGMPAFSQSVKLVYALENPLEIGVFEPSEEVFQRLSQVPDRLIEGSLEVQRTDNQNFVEISQHSPDLFIVNQPGKTLIIGRVNGRFMLANVSIVNILHVQYIMRPDVRGNIVMIPRMDSLVNILQQNYDQLPWEPVQNIVNYV